MTKKDTKEERGARLAENLRANLRRRKQQARESGVQGQAQPSESDSEKKV